MNFHTLLESCERVSGKYFIVGAWLGELNIHIKPLPIAPFT